MITSNSSTALSIVTSTLIAVASSPMPEILWKCAALINSHAFKAWLQRAARYFHSSNLPLKTFK